MELGLGLTDYIPILLYIGGIIVVILTIFKNIKIGMCFLVPFLPHPNLLDWLIKYPLGKDFVDILLIAMIIRWIIDRRNTGEPILVKTPLNLPLIIIIVWAFIEYIYGAFTMGLPISLSLHDSRFVAWKNFVVIPIIFFIFVNNIKNPKTIKIIVLFMIISILFADRGFYNVVKNIDTSHYRTDLKFGGVASALAGNALAVFLAQYTSVMLSLLLHLRNWKLKSLLAFPVGLSYYCIMFTFSRSGYLATVVGLAILGLLKDKKILIGLFILILSYQAFLPVAVKERIDMTKNEEGYDDTVTQRFGMWEIAFNIITSNPAMGAGFDFTSHFNIQLEEYSERIWHSFHNAYLHTAVELGLVGLGIFLWLFFLAIKEGWRLYKMGEDDFQKGLGIGMIGCVFACMAGNVAGTYWFFLNVMGFYWVLLAMVVRSTMIIEQQKDQKYATIASELNETNKKDNSLSNKGSIKLDVK